VLFRDLKYFNYWGRIPRELIRNGATIYYGNQEAVGTIASNAEDLRNNILAALEETGAEKVNIIAHSKGGLDSRYAISRLGMADKVASLTTISTPHRGCRFVDKACRLPEGLYRGVAKFFDNAFRKLGDKRPDFYTATRQFATADSDAFNLSTPDAPGVYYQSYMTKMRSAASDPVLALPWLMIKPLEGDNDGLVSIDSAVWGEFQGVLESGSRRGISHGDIIDLKRADYKGFDVLETYVGIVSDLKDKGF
jgi:triacylglycerol lipase